LLLDELDSVDDGVREDPDHRQGHTDEGEDRPAAPQQMRDAHHRWHKKRLCHEADKDER